MTKQYLYLCERCAPEGLPAEEFATRPLASICFVCGEPASRWYVSAERVLKALLQERMRRAAEPKAEPTAWMYPRRYGSGLSFIRPRDYTDEEGNLVQPVPLYERPTGKGDA